jgi:hypothetical protein
MAPLEGPNKPDWIPAIGFKSITAPANKELFKYLSKNQYIFIGFKNSTGWVQYIELLRDGVSVQDTMIDRYQIRNYIPNVVKAKKQRENKRGVYTIWENVQQHDPSMCGTYISYWDMFQASLRNAYGQLPVFFRVTIQYDQLIMFENFYEYINEIYENLKLKLRIIPDVLVVLY